MRESHGPHQDSVAGGPEISVPSDASRGELAATLGPYEARAPRCAPKRAFYGKLRIDLTSLTGEKGVYDKSYF